MCHTRCAFVRVTHPSALWHVAHKSLHAHLADIHVGLHHKHAIDKGLAHSDALAHVTAGHTQPRQEQGRHSRQSRAGTCAYASGGDGTRCLVAELHPLTSHM